MKKAHKNYLVFVSLLALLFGSGCQELEEDPKSILSTETFLNNEAEFEGAVAAMYRPITNAEVGWGFTFRMTSYFGADDITTDPGLNKQPFREFDRLQGTSDNDFARRQWEGPWQTIYQANNVLESLEGADLDEEYAAAAEGQARFLRALCYFYLVRTYGKLPAVTSTSIDINNLPQRAEVAEIYDIITNDLDMAENLLPVSFPGEPGKPTRNAAKSLYSDVLLTMAGWPLNRTDTYALSAEKAKEVIDSGQYSLVPDYAEVFKTNNNVESVFSLQYNVAGGLPQRGFGSSAIPLEEVAQSGASGWQDYCAEITFFNNAPECKRTDDTFYTTLKLRNEDGTYDLVPWDSPETRIQHPYFKKFRSGLINDGCEETETTIVSMGPSTNKTLDIIRYASTLLNYAEASAMASGGPTSESYNAINLVRDRAGLPPLTPGLGQEQFRDSVVYEKAYEFAGEFGSRWFDIVRLQLLPEVIAERHPNEIPLAEIAKADPTNYYLAPIPFNELAKNPHWEQNPGY
ncbi:MAG: RagB/SusD family nutrient uptake outer membrane protein [Flagellimonas sp.]